MHATVRIYRSGLGNRGEDPDNVIHTRAAKMAGLIAEDVFIEWPNATLDIAFPDDDEFIQRHPNGWSAVVSEDWPPKDEDDLGLIIIGVREEGNWIE